MSLFRFSFTTLCTISLAFWLCAIGVLGGTHRHRACDNHGGEIHTNLKRNISIHKPEKRDGKGKHVILKGPGGGMHPRLEIRTLVEREKQWDLYVLAVQAMQKEKQTNKMGWYAIMGIHGVPNVPYDGVQRRAPGVGYCTHSSTVFGPWHRAYLLLYEQALVGHARKIAARYSKNQRKQYVEAAKSLRQPYWDWAIRPPPGRSVLPYVLSYNTVSINTPSGRQTIKNPLYRYDFHPLHGNLYASPWSHWQYTLRWPSGGDVSAFSQNALAAAALDRNRPTRASAVFQWFNNCPKWLQMSNDNKENSNSRCHVSLESIHNSIHVLVGGNVKPQGHMTIIPYSAMDPSFMLHHANIDRLFAMWQQVHPNTYVAKQRALLNTFAIRKGETMTASSGLRPFRKTGNRFWNSNELRHTTKLGYIYPDVQNGGNQPKVMRKRIKNLYGPNSHRRSSKRDINVKTPLIANNGSFYEYNANIATTRYKLGGTYMVYIFLSDPTDPDQTTWAYDPALVGSYGVFSTSGMTESDIVSTSIVPLTIALTKKVDKGELPALNEEYVVPYLQKHLQWKIVGPNNNILDPATVPDFEVSVVASTLNPSDDEDDFPIWSEFLQLPEVTLGKPGGVRPHIGIPTPPEGISP